MSSEEEDVWVVVSAKEYKTNESYVNVGDGLRVGLGWSPGAVLKGSRGVVKAFERSALSWMDRLARQQAYILPHWGVATAPTSEIGGSLLPHISGMNGLLS